jgi:glycosyltransferase involved in cell wall biosynthesis
VPQPVTAIIPTYNSVGTLGAAIESVLAQSQPPAQVVVVDDGSTDSTPDWVRSRYGSRVDLIVVANGGPSRARNRGIEAAGEPFVAFLDADDTWHPFKLERQLSLFGHDPAIGTVASDWVRSASELPLALPASPSVSPITYHDTLILNRFQTSTVLVRTELVRQVGGFDPSVDGAEDWDLWVRLAAAAPMVKVDEPLVVYRDVSTGYSKDVARVYRTMERLLDKHRDQAGLGRDEFRQIEAWHHLRFAVAFYLMHDASRARMAWGRGWAMKGAALPAMVRYLLPFLARRLRRRAQ